MSRITAEEFVDQLSNDLTLLKEEKYQRHEPGYYAEHEYYNDFHTSIPCELLLTPAYRAFIEEYVFNKSNLHDAVLAFICAYDECKNSEVL